MSKRSNVGSTAGAVAGVGASLGCIFAVIVFNLLVGTWSVIFTLGFWGKVIVHHPIVVPFFVALLLGLVLGEIVVPLAIITYIISLFWQG